MISDGDPSRLKSIECNQQLLTVREKSDNVVHMISHNRVAVLQKTLIIGTILREPNLRPALCSQRVACA